MKNRYIYLILIIFVLLTNSCNLFFNRDTTGEISKLSIKPVVTLLGEPILSLPVGGTYTEQGIEAYVGDSLVDYTIVSGNVNPNQKGFYVVTYSAENQYGWTSNAYRAVLVYSGNAYGSDISGNYKLGFAYNTVISTYPINGYWQMDNVWQEGDIILPIVFADNGDDTYSIVPGEHPSKGKYSGTAEITGSVIEFTLYLISPDGDETTKNFIWTKY
jgi:hypothetical protein